MVCPTEVLVNFITIIRSISNIVGGIVYVQR
jgi:hypothetical protein